MASMTTPSRPADNHVHSQWSWDTGPGASMESTCRKAVEIGLPAVAFTEHLDFTAWGPGDRPGSLVPPVISGRGPVRPLDVEGYSASLEKCRDQFPQVRIVSGIEAGEPHLFAGGVAAVLRSGAFERVLGSLHALVDGDRLVYADELFHRMPAAEVGRRYFGALLDLINGSDAFEVLAHCDYIRRYWPRAAGAYDESVFEEEYRAAFRALARSGRVLEVNTRTPLASSTLIGWWHEEGGGAVSFGSDAHHPRRVGARFDLAVDIVEAAGFRPGRDRYDFWRR
jgi:histidinol-phosphatase (PHP family)